MIALPVDTTLRVRVVASRQDRIALIGRESGLNPTEADRYVESTDLERIRFIKQHFRKDLTDPLLYDLVLNASRFSVEEWRRDRHRSLASPASPECFSEAGAGAVVRVWVKGQLDRPSTLS